MKHIFKISVILIIFSILFSQTSCEKNTTNELNNSPIEQRSDFINPYDFIGQVHNDIMTYYAENLTLILNYDEFSYKDMIQLTYNKSIELLDSSYTNVTLNDYVFEFENTNFSFPFNDTLENVLDFIKTENAIFDKYSTDFKTNIIDYLLNPNLDFFTCLPEFNSLIKEFELLIISDSTNSEIDETFMLMFTAVFKYSLTQAINEFSDEDHPFNPYYYGSLRDELSTAEVITIVVADAYGAGKGAALAAPTGPGGMLLIGVGYGVLASCCAGTSIGVIDAIADWWDS